MCFDCPPVPDIYFGCYSGNVTDYCYLFGREVNYLTFNMFWMLGICLIMTIIMGIIYFKERKKWRKKKQKQN